MAKRNWTAEQNAAINAKGGTLLISAAAGSGKTAVLVERVIKKITDPETACDADKLLVVTYTNAAAAEMRERLSERLSELISENPLNYNLQRQQMLLQNAHISTIHAFCLDLIKENFQKLNITPDFRIADENEVNILRKDILDEIIEQKYAEETQDKSLINLDEKPFLTLTEMLSSGKDDASLSETVIRLYNFMRSLPNPIYWLDEKLAMYNEDKPIEKTLWGVSALKFVCDSIKNSIKIITRAIDDINCFEKMQKAYGLQFDDILSFLKNSFEIAKTGKWDLLYEAVNNYQFLSLGRLMKFEELDVKDRVTKARDTVKDEIKSLCGGVLSCNEKQFNEDIEKMYPLVKSLFDIVKELDKRMNKEKSDRGILDFGDLEQFALNLLINKNNDGSYSKTQTAISISEQFDEILVDEYQDTNSAQDTIFKCVSKDEKNLFMVGDVKQSIYRFRQAMPEIFIAKKELFKHYNNIDFPAKIILGKNFRSRDGVTNAVNFIFSQLMSKELGEIEYNSEEELTAAANYCEHAENDFELHILDTKNYDGNDDNVLVEARHIAKVIKNLVDSGYEVKGVNGQRKATWSDFCILMRSTSTRAEKYMREISLCGVPVWAEIANGYLGSYEVAVMLSFLRILDNPLQDIPLISVMLSPMFGFLPDDIAKLRIENRKDSIYFSLVGYAKTYGDKFAKFIETLNRLRQVAAVLPSDKLILKIYDETAFLNICEAMPNGEKRRANLRLLLDYARNYEAAGYKGLSGFIRFIDRIKENKNDLAPASVISEAANVVRIMSIHKSKGLEFPVCIIAGCAKQFNREDIRRHALFNPVYGFGSKLRDERLKFKYTTLPREIVSLETEKSALSEEMRVLYVAMTRAKEKLIAVATLSNAQSTIKKSALLIDENTQKITPFNALQSTSFAEWIISCAMRHSSCTTLRQIANLGENVVIDNSFEWSLTYEEVAESEKPEVATEIQPEQEIENNSELADLIKNRLAYTYPFKALSSIPTKLSVSEIVAENYISQNKKSTAVSVRPSFLSEQKLTGAEAGTALHEFMQYANLATLKNISDIDFEIKRLVENKFLLPEQGNAINKYKVNAFLNSQLFKRICEAQKVYKEFKFNIEVPACEIYKEHQEFNTEKIIIQGMADMVFLEKDKYYVLDYKTDFVNSEQELTEKYKSQIDIYARAVGEIMDATVAEKYIYSFCLEKTIVIN